jgi:hypothetical protein
MSDGCGTSASRTLKRKAADAEAKAKSDAAILRLQFWLIPAPGKGWGLAAIS